LGSGVRIFVIQDFLTVAGYIGFGGVALDVSRLFAFWPI
jgi:hypothetical protein